MDSTVVLVLAALIGALAAGAGVWTARRIVFRAQSSARSLLHDAALEAENKKKEVQVAAHERIFALQEEADRREHAVEERENRVDERARELDRRVGEAGREAKRLARLDEQLGQRERETAAAAERAREALDSARAELTRISGLTREEARAETIAAVEAQARSEAARAARRIEEEAREEAERRALALMLRAAERVDLRDVVESTVSFIELPSDEMKGRIIGREGRNIRALEMATGIDLIVDDTPRSILISSFDPLRREVARVAIDRLVVDGRIHPARIEEVVEKVREEVEELVEQRGAEAALALGISDLHPRLVKLVGRLRYRTQHGQNLLQHSQETAMIAAHMAQESGARADLALRVGLLHEIGEADESLTGHPAINGAELCAKYGESEEIVEALRQLHPEVEARDIVPLLVAVASRLSDQRPGARKENLAVFIERLRRLEEIALRYDGITSAFAVKSGRELRVIVNSSLVDDQAAWSLSKEIARTIERELSYPGQVKVSVIRETRAVRFAV